MSLVHGNKSRANRRTAMILAAGRGERMRPLTDSLPKPLLEVHAKPLIVYHIEALVKAGYERIVINHAWLGHKLEQVLGDGKQFAVELVYSPETEALETAGGIVHALPLLCNNAPLEQFTLVNGDIYCDFDFANLPTLGASETGHLVMVDNPAHNPSGDFGFAKGRLREQGGIKLTYSGIAVFQPGFFAKQSSGKAPLAPMLIEAIANNLLSAQHHQGLWTDVGTPQRLAQLNLVGH